MILEYFRRLEVLPSLTDLWQIRAREGASSKWQMGLDLAYVESWSFWLDPKILIRTAEAVPRVAGFE